MIENVTWPNFQIIDIGNVDMNLGDCLRQQHHLQWNHCQKTPSIPSMTFLAILY